MSHPLTDEMIDKIFTNCKWWESPDNVNCLRAAYDLGFTAGSQASEGAMESPRRTFEEKHRSHKDPRKWGIKKRWKML